MRNILETSIRNGKGRSFKPIELFDQNLPADLEAERAALGCLILKPDLICETTLRAADFADEAHSIIFCTMLTLRAKSEPIDATLMFGALREAGNLETAGGLAYLAELARSVSAAAHFDHYVAKVKDCAGRRRVIHSAIKLIQSEYEGRSLATARREIADAVRDAEPSRRANSSPTVCPPRLVSLASVQPEPVHWLWPGRIALGKVTMMAGDPGLGKSFLTIDLAARVSRGSAWPDDPNTSAPLGATVILNAEDDLADTIRPRLDKAGANVSKVIALTAVKDDRGDKPFNLQRDLASLEQAVQQTPDCRLVIIDPISAYLGNADSHKNAEVRSMLAPLAQLAARYRVAVVVISHLNKGNGPAMYRTMDSLAFIAAARAAWVVVKDKEEPKRRLLLPVKNNLAADVEGMAFEIVDGMLEWEPEPVNASADDLLGEDQENAGHSERDDAGRWLRDFLKDGRQSPKDVKALAEEVGYRWATIRRAKTALGVLAVKQGFGKDSRWYWELPDQRCAAKVEDAHSPE